MDTETLQILAGYIPSSFEVYIGCFVMVLVGIQCAGDSIPRILIRNAMLGLTFFLTDIWVTAAATNYESKHVDFSVVRFSLISLTGCYIIAIIIAGFQTKRLS